MTRAAPLLPSTTVEDAVACVVRHVRRCAALQVEEVDLVAAHQRILAESLASPWPMPAADVSMMDGWAVRSADVAEAVAQQAGAAVLTASGTTAAGHPPDRPLGPGQAGRIFTGAVLPAGADAVVAQEDVDVDGTRVTVDPQACAALQPQRFVRARGSEVQQGDIVATKGTRLGAGELALLASAGHARVLVRRRPTVAILSTGDELVRLGQQPGPGQLVSSNGIMLAAQVVEAGGEAIVLPEVRDDRDALRAALAQGLTADVLLTSGGMSVGDHDLVREQLEALGVQIHVHGLALRPGKPTAFGTRGDTLVFGLPGNPAGSWVAFCLVVQPALAARSGNAAMRGPMRLPVRVTTTIKGAGRRAHYVRARWASPAPPAGSSEPRQATPLSVQRSGNLRSVGGVELLLIVPVGVAAVQAGEICDGLVLRAPAGEVS